MRVGVYIHIPFCVARCSYCDFATTRYQRELVERYVRAVVREIENFAAQDERPECDSIYLGGGTPSTLAPSHVALLLEAVRARFSVSNEAEVTMEVDPATADRPSLDEFRHLGVNRISVGAQSFDDEELRRLRRAHTAADTVRTIEQLRAAGFSNLNLDLIAGLPRQTLAGWRRNLELALSLRPEHMSLYLLEVHPGTPLAREIERGISPPPDEDLAARMYEAMIERLEEAGYEHYEISNFCLPGRVARHNMKYWTGAPVYGFGCSAHSFDGRRRRWANERSTARYIRSIEERGRAIVEEVELDDDVARAEALFLGLRLMRGIDLRAYAARFGYDVRHERGNELARLNEAGLIEIRGDRLRLTNRGALLSNEVFVALI
jgi:oxygen-independent coproporphyrinogen-3 oxidase